jgi:flagellar hook-basal body complex protein FliE
MNDMLIKSGDLLPSGFNSEKPSGDAQTGGKDFSLVMRDAIKEINHLQTNADEAIAKVQLGNTANIHEAMVALEQASISFRALMQVRNKILDAYQEVMRMQV